MTDDTVEALDLLCEIVESGEIRFAASAFEGRASAVSVLTRGEILTPDGVVSSVVCDACDEVHEAALEYFPERGCHGWYCPNVGRIEADAGAVSSTFVQRREDCSAPVRSFPRGLRTPPLAIEAHRRNAELDRRHLQDRRRGYDRRPRQRNERDFSRSSAAQRAGRASAE